MRSLTRLIFLLALLGAVALMARDDQGRLREGGIQLLTFVSVSAIVVMYLTRGPKAVNPLVAYGLVIVTILVIATAAVAMWIAGSEATVLLVVAIGIATAIAWRRERTRELWTASWRCPKCGYDVRATPERCPECDEPMPDESARLRRVREAMAAAAEAAVRAAGKNPPVPSDNPPQSADPGDESPTQNL